MGFFKFFAAMSTFKAGIGSDLPNKLGICWSIYNRFRYLIGGVQFLEQWVKVDICFKNVATLAAAGGKSIHKSKIFLTQISST